MSCSVSGRIAPFLEKCLILAGKREFLSAVATGQLQVLCHRFLSSTVSLYATGTFFDRPIRYGELPEITPPQAINVPLITPPPDRRLTGKPASARCGRTESNENLWLLFFGALSAVGPNCAMLTRPICSLGLSLPTRPDSVSFLKPLQLAYAAAGRRKGAIVEGALTACQRIAGVLGG